MLPPEVLVLVLAATGALAIPQGSMLAPNITTIDIFPTPDSSAGFRAHPESTVNGWGDGSSTDTCDTPGGCTPFLVHVETTVSGFEDHPATSSAPNRVITPHTSKDDRPEVVTTSLPSLVDIHTELQPTTQPQGANPSGTPGSVPSQPDQTPIPGASPSTSPTGSLLLDIVSHLGIPAPSTESEAGSTEHTSPTTGDTNQSNEGDRAQTGANVQPQQATETLDSTQVTAAGGQITLGSAVLTLTPGLSSVLGNGPTATYVAITTDASGKTLITVSSSGTAVTATITDAPATVTKPRTGFEASITTAARPASLDSTSTDNAIATTSSKALAIPQRVAHGHWLYAGVGLLGLGLAAG